MKLKQKKNIFQKIIAAVFLTGGIMLSVAVEAKAELSEYAILAVEDQVFVEDGQVLMTELSDGQGGTAAYDPETNTLTLDNYTFTTLGWDDTFIFTYNMDNSDLNDSRFRIILEGCNTMFCPEEMRADKEKVIENFSVDLGSDTVIEGNGKLITNTAIGGGYKFLVRDCDLIINGYYHGFDSDYITLQNANVTLTTEDMRYFAAALYVAGNGYDGNLTIDNSILRVKADGEHWQSVMIMREEHSIDQKLILSEDVTIVDDAGSTLNVCQYSCWTNNYFVFSKEREQGAVLNDDALVSKSVNFISAGKQAQVTATEEVMAVIDGIGEVTLTKKAAIEQARAAYEALERFGEQAEYVKAKVYNYSTLQQAEELLKELEEAESKKETPGENPGNTQPGAETPKAGENALGEKKLSKGDKIINVDGKEYILKKPKIKSIKSKKKNRFTIVWTTDQNCSGYQLSYSTNKKFKKSKTKTVYVKKSKTKTKTFKKLKSGKTYYVRIREYKKIDGKKYFGNWSKVKKIRIK